MNRKKQLEKINSTDIWDVVVIGGGATGLGTTLDAASRGLKVLCVEKVDFSFEVPATYVGKTQGLIHKYNIVEEKWLPNGSLIVSLNVPVGVKMSIINELNNITHGEVIIKTKE